MGESLVIHCGNGKWFIIDSCLCPESRIPIAIQYLESINVDYSQDVQGILISHWHKDHIAGASDLAKLCTRAKIYFSSALLETEGLTLATVFRNERFSGNDSEVREFREIIEHIKDTGAFDRARKVTSGHQFFSKHSPSCSMIALSPSHAASIQAVADLVELTPSTNQRRRRIIAPVSANLNAVALHFKFGDISALLGADLEITANQNTGWSAILQSDLYQEHGLYKSNLYKVAHHGSITAHDDQIWDNLLTPSPISIATCYARSRLPGDEDIERIKSLSSDFYLTTRPGKARPKKRAPDVERQIQSTVKSRSAVNVKMGHIQIRFKESGSINVAHNRAAIKT